ncbi:GGDEF domain-containing protein [Roseococcus sp. SYP-B2431]|uniref:GGDEF domain-containing protein n=1 Tax=Roseococcus sp. SYP-B2431 TaxID=2496640 RepID=UPI00103B9566|nr:GGDEF domain-containing protein [Roseococcus sp. SYP-B2431]TCI00436.1 GGDEF domain-containing protein [Roseococcus sp. SYP-B2431]
MLLKDYIFLLVSLLIGLLCLYAASLAWRQSRRYRDRPERRLVSTLGSLLMAGLGIMEILGGLAESVLRQGQPARPLDWFWLGGDLLLPCFALMLVRASRLRDELEHQLAAAAAHDPLTGLPNRAGFAAMAMAALAASRAAGQPAVVALLDIDHFKSINDGWGHAAGDEVLRGVARATRPAIRTQDVLGRVGGEEFAMVLPGVDPEAALLLVERLREAIRQGVAHPGAPERSLTISGGLAQVEGNDMAALEAATQRADRALYAAKAAGRNRALIADAAAMAA